MILVGNVVATSYHPERCIVSFWAIRWLIRNQYQIGKLNSFTNDGFVTLKVAGNS